MNTMKQARKPDVRARVSVVGFDAVVGGVANAGGGQVGVPGGDNRVQNIEAAAVAAQVEVQVVRGLDP